MRCLFVKINPVSRQQVRVASEIKEDMKVVKKHSTPFSTAPL